MSCGARGVSMETISCTRCSDSEVWPEGCQTTENITAAKPLTLEGQELGGRQNIKITSWKSNRHIINVIQKSISDAYLYTLMLTISYASYAIRKTIVLHDLRLLRWPAMVLSSDDFPCRSQVTRCRRHAYYTFRVMCYPCEDGSSVFSKVVLVD